MFKFPFTNFHEMNLTWIIETLKENTDFTKKVYEEVKQLNATIEKKVEEVVNNMSESGAFDDIISSMLDSKVEEIKSIANNALTTANGIDRKYEYLSSMRNKKILIVGDSNSDENYNPGKINVHWPQSLKSMLSNVEGVTINNRSVAGKQIDWAKTVITEENAASRYYDIIIIMLGTNNYGHATPIETFRTTLTAIPITPQIINGAHVIIVSPPKRSMYVSSETPHVPLVAYMRALYAYAEKIGAQFVDCWGKQPLVNTSDANTLTKWYYDKQLHFNDAYAPIFAQWILWYMITGRSDTIGDYYETIPGRYLKQFFTNTNNFEINENGSFVRVGTRSITYNIIGSLKTFGPNNSGLQPLATLPEWMREHTSMSYLNCHSNTITRGDSVATQTAEIANTDGKLYVTVDGLSTNGTLYRIHGTLHPMLNTDNIIPDYPTES
jgi:lysophospholipase L1-like esterase